MTEPIVGTTRRQRGNRPSGRPGSRPGGRSTCPRRARHAGARMVAILLGTVVLLAGCGGNLPNLPSLTGTASSGTGSTTGSSSASTTGATGSSTSTDTSTTSSAPTETSTTSAETSTTSTQTQESSPSEQKSAPSTGTSTGGDSTGGVSPWIWVLLAAVVVGLVLALVLIRRSRRRRREWEQRLGAAASDVEWFSRALIPQLGQEPTAAHAAGGWRMAAPRVYHIEETLAALVPSAPDDLTAARARRLRDAVHVARQRLDQVGRPGGPQTAGPELAAASAELEAALTPPRRLD